MKARAAEEAAVGLRAAEGADAEPDGGDDDAPLSAAAADPFLRMTPMHRMALIGVFGVYFVAAAALAFATEAPGAEWFIPGLALLVAVRVFPLVAHPEYGWFHPVVLTGLLSLRPLLQEFPAYAFGLRTHAALANMDPERLGALQGWKLTLMAMGVVAYYAGFRWGFRLPVPRLAFPEVRRPGPKALAAVAFSVAVFQFYVTRKGGLNAYMLTWARGRSTALGGNYYWFTLIGLGMMACLLWFALERRAVFRPLFWAAAGMAVTVQFLSMGSRGSVFYGFVVAFMVWMLRERKIPVIRFLALGVVGMVALGVLGNLRKSTWNGSVDWSTVTDFSARETLRSSSLPELVERRTTMDSNLPILASVPQRVELLYGASYAAVVTLPIPRGLWPGKPGMLGGKIGRLFFGMSAGVPATGVGEAYWNFHIPGVLLVFFLFGVFHKWLAAVVAAYGHRPAMILIYAMVMWVAHDPCSDAAVAIMFSVFPLLVLAALFGALRRGRGASQGAGDALPARRPLLVSWR